MSSAEKKFNFPRGLSGFNYKKIGTGYLMVNDWGDYVFLSEKDFADLTSGKPDKKNKYWQALRENGFVRKNTDLAGLISYYRQKKWYLLAGPSLFIMVVTLRCNRQCLYCSASAREAGAEGFNMTEETARRALDIIFQTTSRHVAIEFQGGEPLLAWPTVKYIINEARRRNKKAQKELEIRVVTNGSLATPAIMNYLEKKGVSLCFSLDGPAWLHRRQRGGDLASFRRMTGLIRKFNAKYSASGGKYTRRINARLTVTRFSLPHAREIVDECRKIGLSKFYLSPVNPFGFSVANWKKIGFTAEEFLEFYYAALDYIISIDLRHKHDRRHRVLREMMAATFLAKIFGAADPNHLDYRSPCGAGIGQLAFHYNGDVYTCDEGRMLAAAGDDTFRLGNVRENDYAELVASPVTKTVCTASCTEGLPDCEQCVYRPFCGVCPVYNYNCHGNIFASMPNNERCRINKGILDYLFTKLLDPDTKEVLQGWVV